MGPISPGCDAHGEGAGGVPTDAHGEGACGVPPTICQEEAAETTPGTGTTGGLYAADAGTARGGAIAVGDRR